MSSPKLPDGVYVIRNAENDRAFLSVDTASQLVDFRHVPVITSKANTKVLSFSMQIIYYDCLWDFLVETRNEQWRYNHSTMRTAEPRTAEPICYCQKSIVVFLSPIYWPSPPLRMMKESSWWEISLAQTRNRNMTFSLTIPTATHITSTFSTIKQ
jgi:hypothetical protein